MCVELALRHRSWAWLAGALVVLCVAPVAAQLPEPPDTPSDADVAQARDRFVRGMELAASQRWEAALEEFLLSYAGSGSPAALFNLASTLRELGRFREAREAFDRLLSEPDLDERTRAEAERLRTEVAAQVARLTVEGVPPGSARVLADGEERDAATARPVEVELDPGAHEVAIEVAAHARWDWRGELAPGARLRLTADMPPLPAGADPWPWILGAGGILVVAVAITLAVVDAEAQLDPRTSLVITLP